MPLNESPQLLTVKEAARYLRVSTTTVRRYIQQGLEARQPPIPNGRVLISVEAIEKFLRPIEPKQVALTPEERARRKYGAARHGLSY